MKTRAIVFLFSALIACSTSVFADDISGAYDVVGTEPSGMRYEGIAEINMTTNAKAELKTVFKSGTFLGNCMIVDTDIACYGDAGGDQYIIGLYRLLANGALEGTWVHSGLKGLGKETLTPQE